TENAGGGSEKILSVSLHEPLLPTIAYQGIIMTMKLFWCKLLVVCNSVLIALPPGWCCGPVTVPVSAAESEAVPEPIGCPHCCQSSQPRQPACPSEKPIPAEPCGCQCQWNKIAVLKPERPTDAPTASAPLFHSLDVCSNQGATVPAETVIHDSSPPLQLLH